MIFHRENILQNNISYPEAKSDTFTLPLHIPISQSLSRSIIKWLNFGEIDASTSLSCIIVVEQNNFLFTLKSLIRGSYSAS